MSKFKDAEHLGRLAIVVVVVFLVSLLIRAHFVPKSFGRYGHYRANALSELSAQPISYGGHQVCQTCHDDVAALKAAGMHKGVNCEACHGPLEKHIEDPGSVKPRLPDTTMLCPSCHQANIAKPRNFPQVVSEEHSNGVACKVCHQPHSPLLQPKGNQS